MKRRDVLLSLVGAAGIASAQEPAGMSPSPGAVEELMRAHGLEPMPGEAAQVRVFLLSTRWRTLPDPRIEPALRLNVEIGG